MRERVHAVEDLLLRGDRPGDQALLDLLSGLVDYASIAVLVDDVDSRSSGAGGRISSVP